MIYLETIKSQNGQIYPEDTFSHVAAQMLKHSVWQPEYCFQFKYQEFHPN